MQLSIPRRNVADTGSFPVNPDGVADWLNGLRPLESEADALELYRGLKHSNRLHNDVDQRRAVITCFIPVLRELHERLAESSQAQPLPLTREFARNARLADALLREEAFAFKILLSDADAPSADDARRAMQALARQAEAMVHGYRALPDALFVDAHRLYALAEERELFGVESSAPTDGPPSLSDHYRFILMVSLADLRQQRARQVSLVIQFLHENPGTIAIRRLAERGDDDSDEHCFAVHLNRGTRPEPLRSLQSTDNGAIRWFSLLPLLDQVAERASRTRTAQGNMLRADTLERQSTARLHVALSRQRSRRIARLICHAPRRVVFGHKEVCAHLLFDADAHLESGAGTRAESGAGVEPGSDPGFESGAESDPGNNARPAAGNAETGLSAQAELMDDAASGWHMVNESYLGCCLVNESCRAGTAQVGELISITEAAWRQPPNGGKLQALIGIVRYVHADDDERIRLGVEYLARSVLPVTVRRADASGEVAENALIVACKVQREVLQTVLLPAFLYQSGDQLIALQDSRQRQVQLRRCLQTNGLFSHFSLIEGR